MQERDLECRIALRSTAVSAMPEEAKTFEIVLAEDSLEDAELVRLALEEYHVNCRLRVITDGAGAIEFLNNLDGDAKAPPLDLLLVDIRLPRRDGEDILKCLRSTERYAQTPVIVISGLNLPEVDETATRYAALVYFRKPATFDGYMQLGSIVRSVLEKKSRGVA